jgi:hypothetical protein
MRVNSTSTLASSTLWAAAIAAVGLTAAACDQIAQPVAPSAGTFSTAAPAGAVAAAAPAGAVPDIGGVWDYSEQTRLVLAGEVALAFGLAYEGPVLQMDCESPAGVLTLVQNGSTFTGTLVHPVSTCVTRGGQAAPPPWQLPYEATLSGRVTGRALHIEQIDAPPFPPVPCAKNGTIEVTGGVAVTLHTTGRCDLSDAPFQPATASNSGTATRP